MRSTKGFAVASRVLGAAALCLSLHAPAAVAQVMFMNGTISGTVNGTPVSFVLSIRLDMATGEETATVGNMDPAMGAILRQVTGMVTVGGPTGGGTPHGGSNLFGLSGGNFVNSATMYWPQSGDQVELVHNVSYSSGSVMNVSATINGTVPVISANDAVVFADFSEIMYWDNNAPATSAPQTVTTGVGFRGNFSTAQYRSYTVGGRPTQTGKGSTTTYTGSRPSGPVVRAARDITTTYSAETRTMSVHLFNTLTPVEPAP